MTDAKRDANSITTLIAVSSVDGITPVTLYADPVTHRLLVDTGGASSGATTALDNLASVAINTALLPGVDDSIALGSLTKQWSDLFLGSGAVINFNNDITLTHSADTLTFAGGTFALGANSITMTGSLGTTGSRLTKGWFTDLQVTNAIAGSITGLAATATALANARTIGGVSFDGTANITVASATGGFTVSGGNLALGTNSITMSGSIGVTGTRVTKGWFTDIESTNMPTVGGTAILSSLTAPSFTTIELGSGGATDTTLARVSAGVVSIEGVNILTTATGLPLAGGTMSGNIVLGENTSIALDPAGSADGKYSGITITAVAGYAQAFGDLVYLASADSRWELADADAATTGDRMLAMVVVAGGSDGAACTLLLMGQIRADAKFPALTIGSAVYVGETAGEIQVAIPTGADNVIRRVGYALTADEIYFNPSMDSQISVA